MTVQISAYWDDKLAELARLERANNLILAHLKTKRDELYKAHIEFLDNAISEWETHIQDRRADLCQNILACMGIMGDTNIHPLITHTYEDVLVYDCNEAKQYALSHAPGFIRTSLDKTAFETALHNRDPKLTGFDYKIEQKPIIQLADIDHLADKEGDK